ncbi:hypothetical protein MULP_05271 [Mycobacterium liflandii 128FXT]|uniref:Uncharacterized protein n=1 Tax=Mycobacterium liflandii (strain 128FXT) TaxID=459424 RepID=L7VEL5_MYCL1|nr:hypothetical protein MULP_05271 [Mycobacterium liflandii 128FXT]RFZ67819.1 hypothetical protein BB170200_00929 [Mycobacterium marinum]
MQVAGSLGDLKLGGYRQWHGAGGHHAHADFVGRVHQQPPVPKQVGAQRVQAVDDAAVGLDDAALKFGDVVLRKLREQVRGACRQAPGPQVDKVKLLLDAHRSRRVAAHAATVRSGQLRVC